MHMENDNNELLSDFRSHRDMKTIDEENKSGASFFYV